MSYINDKYVQLWYIFGAEELEKIIDTIEILEDKLDQHDATAEDFYRNIVDTINELNAEVYKAHEFYN